MKHLELYNNEKTYMYPNGQLATPERFANDYPATTIFPHVIETDESGQVCFGINNLSAMRSRYEIDPTLSDSEAVEAIESVLNAVVETSNKISTEELTATSLASIAASMEYQNMLTLDDVEEEV